MNLKEFNSLVDLFFYKAAKENPNADFLEWLNPKNKKKYTWGETSKNIVSKASPIERLKISIPLPAVRPELSFVEEGI